MIVILGALAGGLWGFFNARKAAGDIKDKAQYTAVGAILGGLLGLFVTIGVEKLL